MLVTAVEALLIWIVFPSVMVGGRLKGVLVGLDIAVIVMGSLFLLDVLKKIRVISSLEHYLHRFTPDSRVQAVLLVWLFGGG
jgi:L-lactate permease